MFDVLASKLSDLIKNLTGKSSLTENNIKESISIIRFALIEADVPLKIVEDFISNIKLQAIGKNVLNGLTPGNELVKIVYDNLVNILGKNHQLIDISSNYPTVIVLAGLQGCGKTTTAAKIALWLKTVQKKSILLSSLDIYRPAAIEQLRILANQINVKYFIDHENNKNPIEIALKTKKYAKNNLIDYVILDTAGRLYLDENMMSELKLICENVEPKEILLVVDSMMGQDSINFAEKFSTLLPITGSILTKIDSDTRGGVALAITTIIKKPIKFIGVGERMEDLNIFYPERMASSILGMGDIISLVEEAYNKFDHEKTQIIAKKLQDENSFDLNDFLIQIQQIKKLGGAKNILSKLPNFSNSNISESINDQMFNKIEAIINSMTYKERKYPAFIKFSNKQRIANGSGTKIIDVNRLLKQFESLHKIMHKLKKQKITNMFFNYFKNKN